MTEQGKSFWQTVPGIVTALAALVTAVGGVLGLLFQYDVLGGQDYPSTASQTVATQSVRVTPISTASSASGTPSGTPGDTSSGTPSGTPDRTPSGALVPWAEATATITRADGTATTVKAASVTIACASDEMSFKNGQRLRLDRVRTIALKAIYTSNASADGVVTLLEGRELTDPIHTWNCPITGTNELGSIQFRLEDVRRIEFAR